MKRHQLAHWVGGIAGVALLFSLPAAALADGGSGDHREVDLGGYHLHLDLSDPVVTGNTPVEARLIDAHGHPVTEARVRIVAVLEEAADEAGHSYSGVEETAAEDEHATAGDHAEAEPAADHGHTEAAQDDHAEAEAADDHAATGHDEAAATGHDEAGSSDHDEAEPHDHVERHVFELAAAGEPGLYRGGVVFLQAGHWAGQVELVVDGQPLAAELHFEVVPPDPGRAVLAGFLGLNIAILGAAALLKRRGRPACNPQGAGE